MTVFEPIMGKKGKNNFTHEGGNDAAMMHVLSFLIDAQASMKSTINIFKKNLLVNLSKGVKQIKNLALSSLL